MGLLKKVVELLESWEPPVIEPASGDEPPSDSKKSPKSDIDSLEQPKASGRILLVRPSLLYALPGVIYFIACLGFVAFLVLAIQAGSGYIFGYGIGATIAGFASGRVIELLQNIDDELYRKRMSESP